MDHEIPQVKSQPEREKKQFGPQNRRGRRIWEQIIFAHQLNTWMDEDTSVFDNKGQNVPFTTKVMTSAQKDNPVSLVIKNTRCPYQFP